MNSPLRESFTSHKGSTDAVRQIIVRLDAAGVTGFGAAVFAKEYGADEANIVAALEDIVPRLVGRSPVDVWAIMTDLGFRTASPASALAAVDMAMHDLAGKIADVPLRTMWGLNDFPLAPTALSLSLAEPDIWLRNAKKVRDWPILKIKVTPAFDLELIGRLRDFYRGRIWVDGNGSWDLDGAVAVADRLGDFGVELFEQPIAPGRLGDLKALKLQSPIDLVADEDFINAADVWHLKDAVHAVNIKLVKVGGFVNAINAIAAARQAGLKVMLGCKTESSLGVTAIAQLASLADYLDLDGHLDLAADPFDGMTVRKGLIELPRTAGLGLRSAASH